MAYRKKAPAPPGYRIRHCAAVAAFMGRGYSLTAFAGEIGVTRATLTAWCDKHPAFAAAVEQGQARRARLLEDRLLAGKGSGAFNAHMQALKTAAPDEWPDASSARQGQGKPATEASLAIPDNGRGSDDVH